MHNRRATGPFPGTTRPRARRRRGATRRRRRTAATRCCAGCRSPAAVTGDRFVTQWNMAGNSARCGCVWNGTTSFNHAIRCGLPISGRRAWGRFGMENGIEYVVSCQSCNITRGAATEPEPGRDGTHVGAITQSRHQVRLPISEFTLAAMEVRWHLVVRISPLNDCE